MELSASHISKIFFKRDAGGAKDQPDQQDFLARGRLVELSVRQVSQLFLARGKLLELRVNKVRHIVCKREAGGAESQPGQQDLFARGWPVELTVPPRIQKIHGCCHVLSRGILIEQRR